ncbi:MAG: ABC transporter permease [bacterium]
MSDRIWLVVYLTTVVALTLVHDPRLLAGVLVVALLLAGRQVGRIAWRAVRAVALFNGLVFVGYAVSAVWRGQSPWSTLLLLNLRVLTMTSLTFLFASRVNLQRAVGFSRSLGYLLTLVTIQVVTARRLFTQFGLALRSRTLGRLRRRDALRHGAAGGAFFLRRSLHEATEITQAMASRGFFHDRT